MLYIDRGKVALVLNDVPQFSQEWDTILFWYRGKGVLEIFIRFVEERFQYKRGALMVLSGTRYMDLDLFQNGTLAAQRCADEILNSHVVPYAALAIPFF